MASVRLAYAKLDVTQTIPSAFNPFLASLSSTVCVCVFVFVLVCCCNMLHIIQSTARTNGLPAVFNDPPSLNSLTHARTVHNNSNNWGQEGNDSPVQT